MSSAVKTVGYIGLGNAGYPLAGLLPQAGYKTVVYDNDPSRAEKFAQDFPELGSSALQAVDGKSEDLYRAFAEVDVLVTMLPNGDVVREVLLGKAGDGRSGGVARGLKDGTVIIDTSSASPYHTRSLGDALHKLNSTLTLVDSPITQVYAHALAKGDATLMVGCSNKEALARAMPILKIMGKYVYVMGDLGAGHAMKTLNNYVSAASIVGLCDALFAGQKFGLDPAKMIDVLNVGTGRNFSTAEAFRTDGLTRDWDSGYQLSLLVKDMKIAKTVIDEMGVPSKLSDVVVSELSEALESADQGGCHTQVILGWEKKTGVKLAQVEKAHPDSAKEDLSTQ